MPTRDRWDLAATALRSVLAQRNVLLEVIVVDDGSNALAPVARPFDDPRVRVVRRPTSGGVSSARNLALSLAGGRWITFLDDDDLWHPSHLETLLSRATLAGATFVYSGQVLMDAAMTPMFLRPAPSSEHLERRLLSTNAIGTPSCLLVDSDLVREVGGFDPAYSMLADWDLWLRLAARGAPAHSPEYTTGYRQHEANMHLDVQRSRDEFRRLKAQYRHRSRELGVPFDDGEYSNWLATTCRRSGRRLQAARWFVDSARRGRRPRDLLRALGALLTPELRRRVDRLRPPAAPTVGDDAMALGFARWTITAGAEA